MGFYKSISVCQKCGRSLYLVGYPPDDFYVCTGCNNNPQYCTCHDKNED